MDKCETCPGRFVGYTQREDVPELHCSYCGELMIKENTKPLSFDYQTGKANRIIMVCPKWTPPSRQIVSLSWGFFAKRRSPHSRCYMELDYGDKTSWYRGAEVD